MTNTNQYKFLKDNIYMENDQEYINLLNDDIRYSRKINILILGNVSAGKSTFLNGLIASSITQTHLSRTTMFPSYINIQNQHFDDSDEEIYEQIVKLNQDIKQGNLKLTKELLKHTKNKITIKSDLKDMLSNLTSKDQLAIIDYPGLGDSKDNENLYENHVQRMLQSCGYHAINYIILVLDVNQALNTTSQMNIINLIYQQTSDKLQTIHILVIINKCDDLYYDENADLMRSNSKQQQETIDYIIEEMTKKFSKLKHIKLHFIPYSSLQTVRCRYNKIDDLLKHDIHLDSILLNDYNKQQIQQMTEDEKKKKVLQIKSDKELINEMQINSGFHQLIKTLNTQVFSKESLFQSFYGRLRQLYNNQSEQFAKVVLKLYLQLLDEFGKTPKIYKISKVQNAVISQIQSIQSILQLDDLKEILPSSSQDETKLKNLLDQYIAIKQERFEYPLSNNKYTILTQIPDVNNAIQQKQQELLNNLIIINDSLLTKYLFKSYDLSVNKIQQTIYQIINDHYCQTERKQLLQKLIDIMDQNIQARTSDLKQAYFLDSVIQVCKPEKVCKKSWCYIQNTIFFKYVSLPIIDLTQYKKYYYYSQAEKIIKEYGRLDQESLKPVKKQLNLCDYQYLQQQFNINKKMAIILLNNEGFQNHSEQNDFQLALPCPPRILDIFRSQLAFEAKKHTDDFKFIFTKMQQ